MPRPYNDGAAFLRFHIENAMIKHVCIDPQDPYAQDEVLVAFEQRVSELRLVSAINAAGDDILADLIDIQRSDLLLEIVEAVPITSDFLASASRSFTGFQVALR